MSDLINVILHFCTMLGAAMIIGLVGFLLATILIEFKNKIEDWMYDYKIKHRFNKLPIAKCYCRDCRYHNPETHRCYGFHENTNRRTGDGCFCYMAEPRMRSEGVKE